MSAHKQPDYHARFPGKGNAAPRKRGQQGAVLAFCLIFLLVLTLMAVTGMDTAVVEERMASNMQDHSQAFQAAEAAMEQAEGWLASQTTLPVTSSNGSTTTWVLDGPDPDADSNAWWWERDASWWGTNADAIAGLEEVATQPQYVIEEYFTSTSGQTLTTGTGETSSTRVVHRITVRGTGNSDNSQVLLQSTYIRPYD
jgi:type IV pilus assembly protein PilX